MKHLIALLLFFISCAASAKERRPNILLCIADDLSWENLGCYGDPQARTPAIDSLAREGVRFSQAFCSSPSCSPARAALLAGRMAIELEEAADLWGGFQKKFKVYPDLLEQAGYFVGFSRKGWAPGNWKDFGWPHNPAGQRFSNFYEFLEKRPRDKPFCFWFGSTDPHLPYADGYAEASGFMPGEVAPPPFLMNTPGVRKSYAGYLAEIARFDREVGRRVRLLEEMGELENTIVVVTSDNGMPLAGAKTRLYDRGTHMPLIVLWKNHVPGGRVVDDLVSIPDLAPTFLETAGVPVPPEMSARSLMPLLLSEKSGKIDPLRDFVATCRERHTPAQPDSWGGYPMRAIRTDRFLYIRNLRPERWPQGSYPTFRDLDSSHCKDDYVKYWNNPEYRKYEELALGRRPAEELYDLQNDPRQMHNLAGEPGMEEIRRRLSEKLDARLKAVGDPSMTGEEGKFDTYKWFPSWKHPELGGTWAETGRQGLEP